MMSGLLCFSLVHGYLQPSEPVAKKVLLLLSRLLFVSKVSSLCYAVQCSSAMYHSGGLANREGILNFFKKKVSALRQRMMNTLTTKTRLMSLLTPFTFHK